jgi:AbrB family looped-hinge helix DNA binding protein
MTVDATLKSKRQTTIPKEIGDSLGMKPGDRMTFTLMPDSTVILRVESKSVAYLAGALRKKGRKALPVEQLSRRCSGSIPPSSSVFRFAMTRPNSLGLGG